MNGYRPIDGRTEARYPGPSKGGAKQSQRRDGDDAIAQIESAVDRLPIPSHRPALAQLVYDALNNLRDAVGYGLAGAGGAALGGGIDIAEV